MPARTAGAVVVSPFETSVPRERPAMTGADRRALHSALLEAFPTVADLQRVVSFGLETTLDELLRPPRCRIRPLRSCSGAIATTASASSSRPHAPKIRQ